MKVTEPLKAARRKQTVVLEISYVEELPTDDSTHTNPPAKWNWSYFLNQDRDPATLVIPKVVCASDTEPDV